MLKQSSVRESLVFGISQVAKLASAEDVERNLIGVGGPGHVGHPNKGVYLHTE